MGNVLPLFTVGVRAQLKLIEATITNMFEELAEKVRRGGGGGGGWKSKIYNYRGG